MTTTTGTWYPPSLGTGGFLLHDQLFTNPPFKMITPRRFITISRTVQANGLHTLDAIDEDGRAWWLVVGTDQAPDEWTETQPLPSREAALAQPTPPAEGEVGELVAYLRGIKSVQCQRAADLLNRQQLQHVPVGLRPWERDGWCDEQGECWLGDPGGGGFIPSWRLCRPEDAPNMKVSLPHNALPLPSREAAS